jgi:hypothetical protein
VDGLGPADGLILLEPEGNLLLGVLDGVGAVADVAADILHIFQLLGSGLEERDGELTMA